jgi:hypothetical protein
VKRAAVLVLVVLAGLPACRSSTPAGDARIQGEARSSAAVRRRLEEMVDFFCARFVDATDDLRASTADPELQRRMIVAKRRLVPDARRVLEEDNPLDGLIDLWVMAVQYRDLFATPVLRARFGPEIEMAERAAAEVVDTISADLRVLLGESNHERAQADVARFAEQNPMSDGMTRHRVLPSDQPKSSGGGLFSWVPSIGLSPFGGVGEGISEGAAAIRAFAVVADRFTTVADSIPERVGWELELFEHDFAHNPAIVEVNRSTATIAASIDRIATTAETLPAAVGRELQASLDTIDPKLDGIRSTLVEAEATARGLEDAAAAFTATAAAMEPMAAQLERTLQTFRGLMAYLSGEVDHEGRPRPPAPLPAADEPPARPFDILEYERTATSIAAMAAELRTTLGELRGLVGDPSIPRRIEEVGGATQDSLRSLIREATVAAVVVLVVFFGLLYGYRRLLPPRAA